MNQILTNPNERYIEIYKIINTVNNKLYIGQTVSHVLNHKKYRPYGHIARFKSHVSEAYSTKKNQSLYLNNAIKKYGAHKFIVELIETCHINNADERETYYIDKYNSLCPNGYNLKNGGKVFRHTNDSKIKLSIAVNKSCINQKYERFKNIDSIDDDIEQYIKPLRRDNTQYGWYVLIKRKKADFGGIHIPLDESKIQAVEFINTLKYNLAKHLDAGNP
jgi:group I intron endonuclease